MGAHQVRIASSTPHYSGYINGKRERSSSERAKQVAQQVQGETDEQYLRRRCQELADELRQFLEKNENLQEEQVVRLYNRHLGDKASALLEELEEHGLYPPQNLKSYQLAANAKPLSPFAIRNLAKTLGTIGHKRFYEAGDTLQTQRSPEELKAFCLHLASDVATFDHSRRGRPGDATDEYIRRRDEETLKLYHDRYKPRITDLYSQLAPGHWFDDGDRELFENVGDWKQIGDVAERLKTVGERLPDS